jgi:EAL domain-containing protein (putative c-di-GMP-specific phosphodiesterase class I)
MELEMDLRVALENDEFFLVYQPTFNLQDMTPTGMEALIRWNSETRGTVQPNDFIPLLEETGLIVEIGKWVLREACLQGVRWREAGHPIGVAVNVSARQLDTDELVTDVERTLRETGLDANMLTIEITESALMRDVQQTSMRLATVKELGVRVAIDDFGTGYSSLAYLQRLPIDILKIDRSFVATLTDENESVTLVNAIIRMAEALGHSTIAEGIEQESQDRVLRRLGCRFGQGYLLGRPLDAAATERLLRSSAPATDAPGGRRSRLKSESLYAKWD